MDAATLFENTMDWLRERGTRGFSKEADLVQAVQARIGREIETKGLHHRTAKERILVGGRADLVMPVPVDARQPQARQRYIVSANSVHGSGKPFYEPFSIPDTTLVVETMVDKVQAKAHAIKLLMHCNVDPRGVLVLR